MSRQSFGQDQRVSCSDIIFFCRDRVGQGKEKLCRDRVILCRDRVNQGRENLCHDRGFLCRDGAGHHRKLYRTRPGWACEGWRKGQCGTVLCRDREGYAPRQTRPSAHDKGARATGEFCRDKNSPYPGQLYCNIISPCLGQLCRDIKILCRYKRPFGLG